MKEKLSYRLDKITVLDYDSPYTGEKAIQRLVFSDCEHFVTEVRTGEKVSIQARTGVALGLL